MKSLYLASIGLFFLSKKLFQKAVDSENVL